MISMRQLLAGASLFALVSGAGFGLATAQEQSQTQSDQTQSDQTQSDQGQTGAQATPPESQAGTPNSATADQNRLVAKVNDVEIREQDVLNAIGTLPAQVQQMPQQMLLPLVVEQLLTRQLILERGNSENLGSDPEVEAIVEEQTQAVQDRAVINVWLERAIADRITEERINEAYKEFQAENPDSTATLDAARPELQQALRQEAMRDVAEELRADAEIVFFDASGNPVSEDQAGGGAEDTGDEPAASGPSGQDGEPAAAPEQSN